MLIASVKAAMLFRLNSQFSLCHTYTRLKTNADWLFVWRIVSIAGYQTDR